MDKAINAIQGMSICASEHYAIPKSTLGDVISGRVLPGSTSGPRHYLNDEEEEELVTFFTMLCLCGIMERAFGIRPSNGRAERSPAQVN